MIEYDWGKVAVNTWSVELDTAGAIDHLAFSADIMRWFRDEGQAMLESAVPLSHEMWDALLAKSFVLLRDFHRTKSVTLLFVKVVERGIADLATFISSHDCCKENVDHKTATAWFQTLMYQIQPGARLGINGEVAAGICDTRELLLQLVPVVQGMQSASLLEQLAEYYHPGDVLGQQLFIAHFKNWA